MHVLFVIKTDVNRIWIKQFESQSLTARALQYGDDKVDHAKACGKCSVVSE